MAPAGAYLIEFLIWGLAGRVLSAVTFGVLAPILVIGQYCYLAFFVWYFGGNVGHLVLGARVVNYCNGAPVSPGQAIGRAVAHLLDLLVIPWLVNCAMVLFRADRRHLHDLMVGTVVVYDHRTSRDRWTRIAPR